MTSWTDSREHVEDYTRMMRFGGPVIYETTVDPEPERVLDLRGDVRRKLGRVRFPADNIEWDSVHDLVKVWAESFSIMGYDWVVFSEGPPDETEWFYLGRESLPVVSARQSVGDP